MPVVITKYSKKRIPLSSKEIEYIASRVYSKGTYSFALVVAGEQRMQSLNRKYRRKNKVTDILSFPVNQKVEGVQDLGDIIVCPTYIESKYKKYSQTLKQHYTILLIHGLFHLLGEDHGSDKQYVKMLKKELAVYKLVAQKLHLPKQRTDLDFNL